MKMEVRRRPQPDDPVVGAFEDARRRSHAQLATSTALVSASSKAVRQAVALIDVHARRRRAFEGIDLFGDPAWDILLDLFGAQQLGRRVTIGDACLAAGSPSSTALRYVELLRKAGLIERRPDPTDRRRHYLALTPDGLQRMTQTFD